MQSIGRGLTVGLTAPLTAIGVSSFRTARDFEFSMQRSRQFQVPLKHNYKH